MRLIDRGKLALAGLLVVACLGAAPAAPSYHAVEQSIGQIRRDWARQKAPGDPNAPAWNTVFDAILADLSAYSRAGTDADRLAILTRLNRRSDALAVAWPPATELREGLSDWLRPRLRVATAGRQLVERVRNLSKPADAAVQNNRAKWVKFVETDLAKALKDYDASATVAQRVAALESLHAVTDALKTRNRANAWGPSIELQAALDDLCDQRNIDISIDAPTLSPVLATQVITSGPVPHKGYIAQVTAGEYRGFGLMSSDDGIAFYNRQMMSSVTPIWDFQNQMASDPRGSRATKLYQFNAASTDASEMTVVVVMRPSGLSIYPQQTHNVGMLLNSVPTAQGGFGRFVAALVGFNQARINAKVREGAIGPMREKVVREAAEVSGEKTAAEAAVRNAKLAQYLIGNNQLAYNDFLVEALSLRSRPENALIAGTLTYKDAPRQMGADIPQPPSLVRPASGISADLHLSSIFTNLTRGFLQSDAAREVENLMVVTRKAESGRPPSDGFKVTQNVGFPQYLRAVDEARAANDPNVAAIRLKKPSRSPQFGVDAKGNLVALVNDLQIEVPAPTQAAKGGVSGPPARVYRITSPQAEFVIAVKVEAKSEREPVHLVGKIDSFDPGRGAKVFAIDTDEKKAAPLPVLQATFVLGGIRGKLMGTPIDLPAPDIDLRGFAIHSVSALDPSGWVRVNLTRAADRQLAGGRR
jgi:hypothetical protein